MTSTKGLSAGFEFLDIEIIDHKKDTEVSNGKWKCDQCSLVFLSKEKLIEHKSKHIDTSEEALTCRYCNKTLSLSEDSKDCYANRKCNTCEYKCANCPLRFQRQSSLLNHEKTHKMFKKNKKSKFTTSKLKNMALKQKKSVKRENEDVTITPIKLKKMKTQISPIIPHTLTNDTVIDSNNCNYTGTNNNKSQETKTHSEKKQNMKTSTQGSANNSSQEHSINYKPFSCHICGDNFASGESLLEHIPSHGEDTSGFKCKHCGDKFDDIYKMQYHLATCPLAEDETNLVKNLASRLVKTPGGPPRRQGRPRKIKESPYNIPGTDKTSNINSEFELNNTNHSRPKRKKRNLAMSNLSFNEFVDSNCSEIDDNVHDETEEDPLNISDTLYESYEPVDEEKTKVHCCPFPRCDMKFSREKALLCHMRNHSDDFEDSYKCHKCDIPFDDIHSLRLHLNECTDIKEECLDKSSEPDFEEYTCTDKTYSSLHKKKGDFICSVCGKVYQSQEKLKSHNSVHRVSSNQILRLPKTNSISNGYSNKCNLCLAEFKSELEENNHMIGHARSSAGIHCSKCFLIYSSEKALFVHNQQCASNNFYEAYLNLKRGVENSHKNVRASSKTKAYYYEIPYIFNNNEKDRTHICSSCSEVFKSHTELYRHERRHSEVKIFCPLCCNQFPHRGALAMHVFSKHVSKLKTLVCQICRVAQSDSKLLTEHIMLHDFSSPVNKENMLSDPINICQDAEITPDNKDLKIICPLCPIYLTEDDLKLHIPSKHLDAKSDLICTLCERQLPDDKEFACHLLAHATEIRSRPSRVNCDKNRKLKDTGDQKHIDLISPCSNKFNVEVKKETSFNDIAILGNVATIFCPQTPASLSKGDSLALDKVDNSCCYNSFSWPVEKTDGQWPLKQEHSSSNEVSNIVNNYEGLKLDEFILGKKIKTENTLEGNLCHSTNPLLIIEISDKNNFQPTELYYCAICSHTFATMSNLRQHVIVHI